MIYQTTNIPAASNMAPTRKAENVAAERAFSAELAAETAMPNIDGRADFTAGRIGIDLNSEGIPSRVSYFDKSGQKLTTSAFSADSILRLSEKFQIDLGSLKELAVKLDEANVGYRPYELYPGTGSDHGIDLNDLAEGGLGTAYDWRKDSNIELKDEGAKRRLEANQQMATRFGVSLNADVTTQKGIDPTKFAPIETAQGVFSNVAWKDNVAVWFGTKAEAQQMALQMYGTVKSL
ncbi:hypothetical protein [Maritalea porphyrae]|uniref:hypothetical protein n=1 Tax=Maritalea porphyrae TaxID=880732 RepID=UPI0022AEA9CE|nr:hypothetical protein [Maritalea porphyrae]MCZ4271982.1 hypothetical protein [Maritalea porphyrae]